MRRFWPSFKPSKGAIVTDRHHDASALVAQALADTSGLPIQVFTSYDAALEWLRDESSLVNAFTRMAQSGASFDSLRLARNRPFELATFTQDRSWQTPTVQSTSR